LREVVAADHAQVLRLLAKHNIDIGRSDNNDPNNALSVGIAALRARLNHALHLAAICQIRQPHSDGRAYFDRKLAEGKTNKDAIRSRTRHISNAVYRQLLSDADSSNR
jgi:hypothetical protein